MGDNQAESVLERKRLSAIAKIKQDLAWRSVTGVPMEHIVLTRHVAQTVRNKSAPPKWSKLWTDVPQPGDRIGAYTPEHLEQMNQEFTAAVERAFRSGGESSIAARRTYDMRRPRTAGQAR